MTVTVIGDIHFDKLTHRIPKFNQLLSQGLRSTLDDAVKRGSEAIVLLGDITDNPYPSQNTLVEFMEVITDYDLPFYAILGNHDYADATIDSMRITKWMRRKLKSNIRIISSPKIIKIGGVSYHFMPHPFVQPMSSKADYAFAHFAVNGARGDNGYTVRTKNQPAGNFILGDFHTAQEGKVKKCIFDYVGSLTQLSWEEDTKKSVITIEDGEKVRYRVKLPYKLIKYTISSDDELNACRFEKGNFYYIKTKDGYITPKGWNLDHPMVVRTSAVGVKKDKRAALLISDAAISSPLTYLEPYLLSKKHSVELVSRCMKLAEGMKIAQVA